MLGRLFIVLGISHKTAPIALRERVAFAPGVEGAFLRRIISAGNVEEAVVLSTCNRTEIYAAVADVKFAFDKIESALSDFHNIPKKMLEGRFYRLEGSAAASHLFKVASGLDSLVPGESQINAQVKNAYDAARSARCTGPVTNLLFQRAFKAAKKVYTLTGVDSGKISTSAVGVELVERELGTLRGKSVLIIGAGKIGKLSAVHFRGKGVSDIYTANRSPARAAKLAREVGGEAVALRDLDVLLPKVDVVVGCTSAKDPVLHRKRCMEAISMRGGRPLVILDLGVPRNVEPAAGEIKGVRLFDIDHLGRLAAENMDSRKTAARRGMKIAESEADYALAAISSFDRGDAVRRIIERFENIRASELERARNRLGNVSERQRAEIERMTKRIVGKILHQPLEELKKPRPEAERRKIIEALEALLK
jgi:glutamyl-tRNA reductase